MTEYDTIAALSTPKGKGGIAVIRISGPDSYRIVTAIFKPLPKKPSPRKALHGFIHDGQVKLDEGLAVYFPAPFSYTGEEVCELSLHSNPSLIDETLRLIYRQGARPAFPGEFSYRAFRSGKIDLLQAEAVNELIQANSAYYAKMEFNNLQGKLSTLVNEIRTHFIRLATAVETVIEFQEDHLLENISTEELLLPLQNRIETLLSHQRFHDIFNRGLRIAIAGRVNAGKSTLFNALLHDDRSIVSASPGTTRDYISETLHIDTHTVQIIDMAGLRNNSDCSIENEGIARSWTKLSEADLIFFVIDAMLPPENEELTLMERVKPTPLLILLNKTDIASAKTLALHEKRFAPKQRISISAKKGTGMESVRDYIKSTLHGWIPTGETAALNIRQRECFSLLLEKIKKIGSRLTARSPDFELIAEEIRAGMNQIAVLTGAITPDSILNQIFARFCIGK